MSCWAAFSPSAWQGLLFYERVGLFLIDRKTANKMIFYEKLSRNGRFGPSLYAGLTFNSVSEVFISLQSTIRLSTFLVISFNESDLGGGGGGGFVRSTSRVVKFKFFGTLNFFGIFEVFTLLKFFRIS